MKLCLNSHSVVNTKDKQKFNVVLNNSLSQATIEPETYYNSVFELLVHPNDDSYVALVVKRLFHSKRTTDYSNIQLQKVQYLSREQSQLYIVDVFFSIVANQDTTLNFFKLETQAMRHRNYLKVFWHPLAGYPGTDYQSTYLCLLTSKQEKR